MTVGSSLSYLKGERPYTICHWCSHGMTGMRRAGTPTFSQTSRLMTTWLSDRDFSARTIIFSTIGLLPCNAHRKYQQQAAKCSCRRAHARGLGQVLPEYASHIALLTMHASLLSRGARSLQAAAVKARQAAHAVEGN